MGSDVEQVTEVLKAFAASDWTELTLVTPTTRLELSKDGRAPEHGDEKPTTQAVDAASPAPASGDDSAPAGSRPVQADAPTASAVPTGGTGVPVKAPSVGRFWAAAEPGAAAFVSVGDAVTHGETLCIVEVMKLMNYVTAEVAGTITEVLVANGDSVEHGQTLFRIEPSA